MSVATSFPYTIKIPSSQSHSPSSSSTSNPSSSSSFCSAWPSSSSSSSSSYHVIRCYSQADGPIRRPVAPMKPTPPSLSPSPPMPPSSSAAAAPAKPVAAGTKIVDDKNVITLEFQRLKAKELQDYFKQKKLEEANQGPFFGFVGKNEISNGRWAMFGFAVGMLTEYATGSDFVDQVKILLSNFGILDIE